jgi:inosine/xanthosine triphosphatase
MRIVVGTTNAAKVGAVAEVLADYPHLRDAHIVPMKTETSVADQPKSLRETVEGALHRAKNVFKDCDYSIGIESGLMEVPYTKGGYMDVCVACVYDGQESHIGLSSAWEFPDPSVTKLIMEGGRTMSEAINEVGISTDPAIGSAEGAVGIMTKGRIDRKEQTKHALQMALIHIDQY